MFAILVAASSSLAEYIFKSTLKAHYARDDMAAFMGVYEAALSAGVLRFAGGASAATGAVSPAASAQGTASAPPTWMSRATRGPLVSRAASVADQAIRSGDRPSGGASVDLSEGE